MKKYVKGKGGYDDYACDLCGYDRAIEVPYARMYTKGKHIHICKRCGFVYVKLRRPYDKIIKVWSDELFQKAYTSKDPLMVARHSYIAEFMNQKIGLKNKLICDIGAGEGQFLNMIRNAYRARVFGIEPSERNCGTLKKMNIKYFCGALEDYMKYPSHKRNLADIVSMMWTIENSSSPRDLLIGAREIMKDNGRLVVATGSRILVPFSKPLSMYLGPGPMDIHAIRFSANTLTSFLATAGFEVIEVNPYLNDNLALCVIAKKSNLNKKVKIRGDDYRKVRDYFIRWHKETAFYKGQE